MKKLLHIGCGPKTILQIKGFNPSDWQEIRFDIDPSVKPDVIGTLTDMSALESDSVDAVFSSHNIEHLYPHEVPLALKEIFRVLKPSGFLLLTCPDIQTVCEMVANDHLIEPLYNSAAGPISAIDILYGHRRFIAQGNHFMAHRCGFTFKVLTSSIIAEGFKTIIGRRDQKNYALWVMAFKTENNQLDKDALALQYFS
ncbi:class I SAM-dependent methyltransferase [Polynucleobacter rarus]|uniref:class I SAM-dependent methyltransferase n=1 Tax=Polynucleobacter rarus TaxID=556055 RepID=UPI000D3EA4A8|nr:methyltransferase domain-containing protein [Polynucleobacter rarus]